MGFSLLPLIRYGMDELVALAGSNEKTARREFNPPGGPACTWFVVKTVTRRLNVICNVPTSAASLSIKTITNGGPN
jgi:hypothetical protein